MYSKKILERFYNPEYAGGLRGAEGSGKAEACGDVLKIYIQLNQRGKIQTAKFKAYGGVCLIVAGDIACELIENTTLEEALRVNSYAILEEMGDIGEEKEYVANMAEEAIKTAIEDYYKKKEKEEKKSAK